ncbi:MAG: spore coat protein GerQ [Bacillaceae bacterium]
MSYPPNYYPYDYDAYFRPTDPPQTIQGTQPMMPTSPQMTQTTQQVMPSADQTYVEQIIRFNRGNFAYVYMTFPGSGPSGTSINKVFYGMILSAGRDHIILRDFQNNRYYMLLMVYLDYLEFPNEFNYILPPPLTKEQYQMLKQQKVAVDQALQQYIEAYGQPSQ